MQLRVRGPEGVVPITLEETALWSDLKQLIREKSGVIDFDLKYGYPPKPFNTTSINDDTKLSDLPTKLDGEQLIIMPRAAQESLSNSVADGKSSAENITPRQSQGLNPPPKDGSATTKASRMVDIEHEPPEAPVPQLDGVMVLRVMPDDNSCMFRAVSSAVFGSALDGMTELRSIVAQAIQSDPEFYNEGVLGMERSQYCRMIQREDRWGGFIELLILAKHFEMEIVSIDVQTLHPYKFNEGVDKRCFIVYSGIHYDVLAVTPFVGADPEADRKVFDVIKIGDQEEDGGAFDAALKLCKELQTRHYFTDTAGFDVRCNICGQGGNGEKWAMLHAQETGHVDFGEGK